MTIIISTHRLSLLSMVDRMLPFHSCCSLVADGPRDKVLAILQGKPVATPAPRTKLRRMSLKPQPWLSSQCRRLPNRLRQRHPRGGCAAHAAHLAHAAGDLPCPSGHVSDLGSLRHLPAIDKVKRGNWPASYPRGRPRWCRASPPPPATSWCRKGAASSTGAIPDADRR